MVKVDIPVLFQTVEEKLSVFPIENDINYGSFVHGLYDGEVCSFYPYIFEVFFFFLLRKDAVFCQMLKWDIFLGSRGGLLFANQST